MIVVRALSSTTSLTPAGCCRPIGCDASMTMSMCSPWWRNRTLVSASPARRKPTNCAASTSPALRPSRTRHVRRPPVTSSAVTSAQFAAPSGAGLIQEFVRLADDALAARRVVAAALLGAAVLRDHVGAIQRVVEAAPARVGRVQCVARIVDRHDELRSGHLGDLRIDVGRRDLERRDRRVRGNRSPARRRRLLAARAPSRGARRAKRRSSLAARRASRAAHGCAGRACARSSRVKRPDGVGRDSGARRDLVAYQIVKRSRDVDADHG